MDWGIVIDKGATPFVYLVIGIVFVVTQRKAISRLIEGMKFQSIEAEKGKLKIVMDTQLAAVKEDILKVEPAPEVKWEYEVPSTDPMKLVAAANALNEYLDAYALSQHAVRHTNTKPAVIVERAWRDVETLLYRIVEGQERPSFTYMTGNELLQRAASRKLFDRKLLEAIAGLLNIWNETITAIMGWEPSTEQASEYVKNAEEVMRLLAPYLTVGLPKQPVEGERSNNLGL